MYKVLDHKTFPYWNEYIKTLVYTMSLHQTNLLITSWRLMYSILNDASLYDDWLDMKQAMYDAASDTLVLPQHAWWNKIYDWVMLQLNSGFETIEFI